MIIAWDEFEFAERSDLVKPGQDHAHDCGEGHEHLQRRRLAYIQCFAVD